MSRSAELPSNVSLIGKTKTKGGNEKNFYSVICLFCGKARNITRHDHATRLAKHPCKSCSNKNNNPQGESFGLRNSWFNKYKLSAFTRSLKWEIDIEYVSEVFKNQGYVCALSGIPITASGDLKGITASIDRIDNYVGYVKGNIQLVHKKINMMRGTLSVEDFKAFCRAVAQNGEMW